MVEMLACENFATELRSVFQRPHESGVLYIEAQFQKANALSPISKPTLQDFVRSQSTIKSYSLALVSSHDYKQTLSQLKPDNKIFHYGEWIRIARGLYKDDVGLCVESNTESTDSHITVLLVPRIPLAPIQSGIRDIPYAFHKKRKRGSPRPPLGLFDPALCPPDDPNLCTLPALFDAAETGRVCYEHKVLGGFEHGLLRKVFDASCVVTAPFISSQHRKLLFDSGHPEIRKRPMLLQEDWHFELGDVVTTDLEGGEDNFGEITELHRDYVVVNHFSQGLRRVPWEGLADSLSKHIVPGDYIMVKTGQFAERTGMVAGKIGRLLGVVPDGEYTIVRISPSFLSLHSLLS